jgi:hypothetical protein
MVSDADGREPSIVRRAAESVTSSAGLDAPTELGALYGASQSRRWSQRRLVARVNSMGDDRGRIYNR